MKIWRSYGSEHSANLVLIGHFKDSGTAEATAALIEELHEALGPSGSGNEGPVRFPGEVMKILERVKFTSVAPQEVDHFRWGYLWPARCDARNREPLLLHRGRWAAQVR